MFFAVQSSRNFGRNKEHKKITPDIEALRVNARDVDVASINKLSTRPPAFWILHIVKATHATRENESFSNRYHVSYQTRKLDIETSEIKRAPFSKERLCAVSHSHASRPPSLYFYGSHNKIDKDIKFD